MKSDRFLRGIDGGVLAVVTLTVCAICGTIGLTESGDLLAAAPQWPVVLPTLAFTAPRQGEDLSLIARQAAAPARSGSAPVARSPG